MFLSCACKTNEIRQTDSVRITKANFLMGVMFEDAKRFFKFMKKYPILPPLHYCGASPDLPIPGRELIVI